MTTGRTDTVVTGAEVVEIGDFAINRQTIRAFYRNELLRLSLRQFLLLELLLTNADTPVSREVIKKQVWRDVAKTQDNSVDAEIGRLRQVLGKVTTRSPIRTLRKLGFMLELSPQSAGPKFSGKRSRYTLSKNDRPV